VVAKLPKNAVVIIREYDLPKEEREIFATRIAKLARARGLKILVGKDSTLARKIKADGVHFSDFDLVIRRGDKKNLLSISCHSYKSFLRAERLKPDLIFISPIFPTASHTGAKVLGLRYLAKIAVKNRKRLPIYALGGVNFQNLKSLAKLGIAGFGAINFFKWK